ncbi:hypothetical protein I314_03290 [Cryptococcus bacillisporus CA1873]|uniref:Uncharacterized protein n=2 Tax=Cryptococcus gattii TaxID=552467 RepID=A0A0D0UHC3_CRYGA|nr:hypothetical protein I312_03360 [Cryptococcus bacillisporus CA1280]KIR62351.1 hypothetical protein I314_03290 [Cryptococcus bacillisporus CA1873]|eukprot:KIR62351.1 hypothetical protein I314_03290 [Cryptococcus gattii CA1873]
MNGPSQAIGIGHCLVHESAMLIFLSEKMSTGPTQMKGVPFVLSLTPLSIAEASSRARAGRLELVMDLQQIAILLTQPKNAKVQKGHHAAVTLLSGFLRL